MTKIYNVYGKEVASRSCEPSGGTRELRTECQTDTQKADGPRGVKCSPNTATIIGTRDRLIIVVDGIAKARCNARMRQSRMRGRWEQTDYSQLPGVFAWRGKRGAIEYAHAPSTL